MNAGRTRAIVLHIEFKSRSPARDGRMISTRSAEAKLEVPGHDVDVALPAHLRPEDEDRDDGNEKLGYVGQAE